MRDDGAMRHEAFFSGENPYDVLVRGNVLLHAEAAECIAARLAARLGSVVAASGDRPVRFLDLACGGRPMIPAGVFERLPRRSFHYTGIDINPEQVAAARRLTFPSNVEASRVVEGSAWDLDAGCPPGPYDVVFVGLNWHHGTHAELAFLAHQARRRIAPAGLLVNHDCYRPDGSPSVPRPARDADGRPLELVDPTRIAALRSSDPRPPGARPPDPARRDLPPHVRGPRHSKPCDAPPPGAAGWRDDLIDQLEAGYLAAGGQRDGAAILVAHSRVRDYPMAAAEARELLEAAGFRASVFRYPPSTGPLARYLALVVAEPAEP